MVVRRVLDYVVRETGARLIPAAYRAFRKYDIQTTNALFGKSGGKGFRHGRDLGLILGEYVGEDLDEFSQPQGPRSTSYKQSKTRGRYQRSRYRKHACNCRPNYSSRRSRYNTN